MNKVILSLCATLVLLDAGGNIQNPKELTNIVEIIPEVEGSSLDKLSIGGYGKMDYTNYQDQEGKDKLDIYRFIVYLGYQFTDKIKLVSELEWEHGGREETGGYGIVEQAYIDFTLNESASVKVGHVLVPVGWVNLYHEPTAFNAVSRPEVEKYIIPSTWHENGVIVHGGISGFNYQVGILASLEAEGAKNIRSMRQNGQKSKAEDFAFVGRLDYNGIAGFNIGGSFYTGNVGQSVSGLDDVIVTVSEAHASYNYQGFEVRALYAINEVENAQDIVTKSINDEAPIGVASEGSGYYINLAYTFDKFTPFLQYEAYNDKEVSFNDEGIRNDKDEDIISTTIGINYNPTPNIVLKADYVLRDNRGIDDDRFEFGIGYSF